MYVTLLNCTACELSGNSSRRMRIVAIYKCYFTIS